MRTAWSGGSWHGVTCCHEDYPEYRPVNGQWQCHRNDSFVGAGGAAQTARPSTGDACRSSAPERHAARERTYRATVLRELTGARAESMAGFARGAAGAGAADDGALPSFEGDEARALAWYVEFVVPCYPKDHVPLDGLPESAA